jgi:hypothetical protein
MRTGYLIEVFDKKTEKFIKDFELQGMTSDEFKVIFDVSNEADMFGCCNIISKQVKKLRKFATEKFEFDKYNYYISLRSLER